VSVATRDPSAGAQPPSPAAASRPGVPASRLPLAVKLAYGAPSFAGAAMAIPIAIHLTIFYSDVVLVPLGFIALATAVSRAFDALTDPLMGWLSDRTRSRWGRRRPWMALGAPLCGLAFLALFAPPAGLSGPAAGPWFLACYLLYYGFHTVYVIPHYGLGPELSQDYHERSSLFGISETFTVAGTMVAAVLPGLLVGAFGARGGYAAFAASFGLLLTLLYWNLVARVRERPEFLARPPNPLVPGFRRVMRNHVFRILLAVYVIGSVSGAIPGILVPYFTFYVLRPADPTWWLAVFLAVYFGAAFACMPAWVWAARRFGKKPTWLASFVSAVTGSAAIFTVQEGELLLTAAILAWAGSSFGARLFLAPAIQADVIDYDELHTGRRREAQYGALWSVMTKFTVIPSAALPLSILASLGYQPGVEQSETVKLAIRAIFAFGPACFGLIAFAVACFYPISESVHRRIQEGIAAHARGETALDPLTGRLVPPPSERVEVELGWFLDHFSRGELERSLLRGPGILVLDTARWLLAALGLAAGGVLVAAAQIADLQHEPGFLAVLAVVAAGFAVTAALHHALRLRAALAFRRSPPAEGAVRQHLAC
jgi:GPH family glycoside/pentoside/hexuronide:cation symporter